MQHKFFISHYSGDNEIASIFAHSLKRITLDQISPWFSSDTTGSEGLQPGNIWFNQILSKLLDSKAVVALLTPNSINKPWIYFESGIAQALKDCEVIPICIGIKRNNILPPLGLYQCYQLNDYRSAIEFFSKLLALFSITFDEEMSKPVVELMVAQISKITFDKPSADLDSLKNAESMINDLKSHFDKRFIELIASPLVDFHDTSLKKLKTKKVDDKFSNGYSVGFLIDFTPFDNEVFIDVRDGDSFQDLTNTLYFIIQEYVGPFTYLEEWVIINRKSHRHVIIREIADMILAKSIFKPDTQWLIRKLANPYNAKDSSKRVRY